MKKQKIAQGAEAILYKDDKVVIKDRFEKKYRNPEIDKNLRKHRTKREAKILTKLQEIDFPAPGLVAIDDEDMLVKMDFIQGKLVKEVFDKDYKKLSREIGKKVAILHNNNIIHGDLTTSNMILKGGKVHFIDFGLSFFSTTAEDKAVDLHLLKQALESKHYKIFEKSFRIVMDAYRENNPDYGKIFHRYEKVDLRGRNKAK